jgi:hypothetical protein
MGPRGSPKAEMAVAGGAEKWLILAKQAELLGNDRRIFTYCLPLQLRVVMANPVQTAAARDNPSY